MEKDTLTRRQIIVRTSLSVAAIIGTAMGLHAWLKRTRQVPASDGTTLGGFLRLSRLVLGRNRLDTDVARKIFAIVQTEPWSTAHITRLLTALDNHTPREAMTREERWFAAHLVTTWYTGIYFYEGRDEQRVAFDDALMYEAVHPLISAPFSRGSGFGTWSRRPNEIPT